jgi:hypothetical protein
VDEDGITVLKEAKAYAYGTKAEDIEKPAELVKASDGTYNYTFIGWDSEITVVTADKVYTAKYSRTEINNNPGGGSGNGGGTTPPPSPTPDPTPTPDPDPTPTPNPDPTSTPTPTEDPKNDNEYEDDENIDKSFASLFARMVDYTKNSITFEWSVQDGIDEYLIYGAKCKKNDDDSFSEYELWDKVSGDIGTYSAQLEEKGYYKFRIVAIKTVNGKKIAVKRSVDIHGTTLRKHYTSAKKVAVQMTKIGKSLGEPVTVKMGSKKKGYKDIEYTKLQIADEGPVTVTKKTITMKVGQIIYLEGIESNPYEPKKKISKHRGIRYESSDKSKVSAGYKTGRIKAKQVTDDSIEIYAYAQNGVYTTVYIKVVE